MIIREINFSEFCDAFFNTGRNNQFTYDGKKALHTFLEDLSEDCGTPMELDVIAICCDFTEYTDLVELQENYSDITSMDDLCDQTLVIPVSGDSFIIQDY